MRADAEHSLRKGEKGEKDWVITDKEGKTVLELTRYDMWEIDKQFDKIRESGTRWSPSMSGATK